MSVIANKVCIISLLKYEFEETRIFGILYCLFHFLYLVASISNSSALLRGKKLRYFLILFERRPVAATDSLSFLVNPLVCEKDLFLSHCIILKMYISDEERSIKTQQWYQIPVCFSTLVLSIPKPVVQKSWFG